MRSPPDGYTLVMIALSSAVNATLFENLTFIFLRDIAPVGTICRNMLVMVVHPSVPVATGLDLIAYAKAHPNKLNMASPGSGTGPHIGERTVQADDRRAHDACALSRLGADAERPAQWSSAIRLRCPSLVHRTHQGREATRLGVANAMRVEALPDVPAVAEFLPGYEASAGTGPWRATATRPSKSSTSSTGRSMLASPIPKSGRGLPTSAAPRSRCRRPNTATSSPTKPRSGPR